jgi:nucleoside-diphosphate-sugar epimerase
MRILVTGHHGYIGSVLVPILVAAGHEVTGYDLFLYRGCDFGAEGAQPRERLFDVRDATPADLVGIDAIVHLAALSNDPIGDLNPRWTYDINLEGTLALARAAKEAGVKRFVFASSCSMYGAADPSAGVTEAAALRPLTPYAETKARAEQALVELADDDFAPVSMRNATAYGVSPRLRLDVVLNNLVAWGHTTGRIQLLSDGTAWRPLVHVEDIAAATLALLDAPVDAVRGDAFNIGSNSQNYRIRELADIVRARLPACEVEVAAGASPDHRSYRVDFSKFERSFPSCRFKWTARSGADQLANAYASNGLTLERFRGHSYIRLAQVKRLLDDGLLDDNLRWAHSTSS